MVQAPPKPKATVIDHVDRWTVFLPLYAGVDVFKPVQRSNGTRPQRCEDHPAALNCPHIKAVRRALAKNQLNV